ncbi:MAG: hypothetical protein V4594_01160 [Bacteroidota bacterium]
MKQKFSSIAFILIAVLYLFAGCNKETYVESIGHVLIESGDNSEVGYFFFVSPKNAGECGWIKVYVDDKLVGELTENFNGNIDCTTAPEKGIILKVVVKPGSHTIRAVYKNTCKPDGNATYNLESAKCMRYNI